MYQVKSIWIMLTSPNLKEHKNNRFLMIITRYVHARKCFQYSFRENRLQRIKMKQTKLFSETMQIFNSFAKTCHLKEFMRKALPTLDIKYRILIKMKKNLFFKKSFTRSITYI